MFGALNKLKNKSRCDQEEFENVLCKCHFWHMHSHSQHMFKRWEGVILKSEEKTVHPMLCEHKIWRTLH